MYIYSAYVLEDNHDIFVGMFDTPELARSAAEKTAKEKGLLIGKTCGICVAEHYIK